MAVSDLTNTTWVIKDTEQFLSAEPTGVFTANITFTSNGNTYTSLHTTYTQSVTDDYTIYYNNTLVADFVYDEGWGWWEDQAYRTIEITGGTDVTNATLIAWLEANATQPVTYDLTLLDSYLVAGTAYTITVKAAATGYLDSVFSNSVTYVPSTPTPTVYTITWTTTHATIDPISSDTQISAGGTATLYIHADSGYLVPPTVSPIVISGASTQSYSINAAQTEATLVLVNPTSNVIVTVSGISQSFTITPTVTNGYYSGPAYIDSGASESCGIDANSGYSMPTTITINGVTGTSGSTGVTWSYNNSTGSISLSNPTAPVEITASCPATPSYYTIDVLPSNCTYSKSANVYTPGSTVVVSFTPYVDYETPNTVTVTGVPVGGYTYNSGTGEVTITNANDNINITCSCISRGTTLAKGDLIQMALQQSGTNKTYRVIKKIDSTTAEVMYMDTDITEPWDTSGTLYQSSYINTYLSTTWYNTLTAEAQNALVQKTVPQYQYTQTGWDPDTHASEADYSTKQENWPPATTKVYLLDVEDVEMYFGGTGGSASAKTPATFSYADIRELFWNDTSQMASTDVWLRSKVRGSSANPYVYNVYGTGYIDDTTVTITSGSRKRVRPAFTIKLGLVDYTIL